MRVEAIGSDDRLVFELVVDAVHADEALSRSEVEWRGSETAKCLVLERALNGFH